MTSDLQDMLYRRLEKLQVLIVASRQLDKAKPEKKEAVRSHDPHHQDVLKHWWYCTLTSLFLSPSPQAEQARTTAMTAYDSINETAKTEVCIQPSHLPQCIHCCSTSGASTMSCTYMYIQYNRSLLFTCPQVI